jgi:hypothetical protein
MSNKAVFLVSGAISLAILIMATAARIAGNPSENSFGGDVLGSLGLGGIVAGIWFAVRRHQKRQAPMYRGPATAIHTPEDAEQFVAAWLRSNGFPDAVATAASGDHGLDVVAPHLSVQVKRYSTSAIGRPAVQALWGARRTDHDVAAFFTSSRYTQAATDYSNMRGVALFVFDGLHGLPVVPINAHGQALLRTSGATGT